MTCLPSLTTRGGCHADRPCAQVPCFQVLLEAPGRLPSARRRATACASHLGEVVCDLTTWAREHGLTGGQVTVLAVDRPPATCQGADSADPADSAGPDGPPGPDRYGGPARRGFVFSTILL